MIKRSCCLPEKKAPSVVIIDGANINIAINKKDFKLSGLVNYIIFLYKKFLPKKMVIVFEGEKSLERRRRIYPNYKKHSGGAYKCKQLELLKNLPIYYLSSRRMESDDVISILVSHCFDEYDKIIVSSDKDYYQLINESVSVYEPIKKEKYSLEWFKSVYHMPPSNFLYYKAIIGDKSDDIGGIKGLGPEKFHKLFQEHMDDEWTDDFVYDIVKEFIGKKEFFELLYIIKQPNVDMHTLNDIESIQSELNRHLSLQIRPILAECKSEVYQNELIKLMLLGN